MIAIQKRKPFLSKRDLVGWLIMLPSLVLFAFFVWVPLGSNFVMSFFKDANYSSFVGLANYKYVFSDPTFIKALGNTFIYIFYSILIGFLIPIALGILLSEVIHFKAIFRLGIYFPAIISGVAVVFLFKSLYNPENFGVINIILKWLTGQTSLLKDDAKLAIPLMVVAMTWRGAGATMLIYLSSLQTIDTSLYEASRIDGSNMWHRLWYITLPHLKNTITVLFILQIISVFQVFYEPLVMYGDTKGGPNNSAMSLMLLGYDYFYGKGEASHGATVGVVLSLIIISISLVYFMVMKLTQRGNNEVKK
ncbi:MAG: sugar ABC transporter permease [Bacillales bacterium]|jgi:multiple sugar transport system permease protein|nr:sugar ABC transporter permease [Bacillales bacterium]